MSLEVYNNILSKMLNTQQALAKIRSKLEGREGRKCWVCKQFSHLAKNCRNKGGRVEEKKKKTENRFEALASRVMQCGIKEVRRQEMVEEVVKCFRCGKQGHKKWECRRKNDREEVILPQNIWRRIREHCRAKGLPPRGARMSMEGWVTKWEVVTLVECRGCNYKGMKTKENQEQGFLGKEQQSNMWYRS